MQAATALDLGHARLADRIAQARGTPLVLGVDTIDVVAEEHGVRDPAVWIADVLRRAPEEFVELQRRQIDAGASILVAPTRATTAAALYASGQAFRAAALTGEAVDLTREASRIAKSDAWVVGEIATYAVDAGASAASASASLKELRLHVDRLAHAGVSGILVRAHDAHAEHASTRAVLDAAAATLAPGAVTIVELAASAVESALAGPLSACAASAWIVRGEPSALGASLAMAASRVRAAVGAMIAVSESVGGGKASEQLAVASAMSSLDLGPLSLLGVSSTHPLSALAALVASRTRA